MGHGGSINCSTLYCLCVVCMKEANVTQICNENIKFLVHNQNVRYIIQIMAMNSLNNYFLNLNSH